MGSCVGVSRTTGPSSSWPTLSFSLNHPMLPSTYQSMPKRYPFSLSLPDAVHSHKRIVVVVVRHLLQGLLNFAFLPPPPFPSPHLLKAGAWRWRQVYCRNFWRTFYCRTVNIFQLLKYSYLGVCDVLCRKGIVTKTQSGKFSVRINPLTPKQVGRYLGHHTLNVYSITSTTILSLVWRYDNLMLLLNLGTHVLEWTSIKRRLFACKSRQI